MSYYLAIPLVLLIAMLEVSVLPYFQIMGLQPNLMLVFVLCWLMIRGMPEALFIIPFGGVVLGLMDAAPMGTALIAMAPIALLHELRGSHLNEGQFGLTIFFMIIASFAYDGVHLGVYALLGQAGWSVLEIVSVSVLGTLLNLAVLFPVYGLVWLGSADLRRPAFA
jgi:rod shape-determining protein MreD